MSALQNPVRRSNRFQDFLATAGQLRVAVQNMPPAIVGQEDGYAILGYDRIAQPDCSSSTSPSPTASVSVTDYSGDFAAFAGSRAAALPASRWSKWSMALKSRKKLPWVW